MTTHAIHNTRSRASQKTAACRAFERGAIFSAALFFGFFLAPVPNLIREASKRNEHSPSRRKHNAQEMSRTITKHMTTRAIPPLKGVAGLPAGGMFSREAQGDVFPSLEGQGWVLSRRKHNAQEMSRTITKNHNNTRDNTCNS